MKSTCYVFYISHKSNSFYLLYFTFLQVDNIEDSFSIIKSRPKPLAAYLFTNNEQLKKDYVDKISSGGMLINDAVLQVIILLFEIYTWKIIELVTFFSSSSNYGPIFINLLFSDIASIDRNWKAIFSLFGIFYFRHAQNDSTLLGIFSDGWLIICWLESITSTMLRIGWYW